MLVLSICRFVYGVEYSKGRTLCDKGMDERLAKVIFLVKERYLGEEMLPER